MNQVLADRFEVQAELGGGGMGLLYRARDRVTGSDVAIKLIRAESEETLERFDRECRALARVTHPGLVRHIDHGRLAAGRPYLVMEWIEGASLSEHLRKVGAIEPADTVRLGRRIAASLAYLHSRSIVHRDLKPANVMLRGRRLDDPVLLDLGAARLEEEGRLTASGILIGTPWYMAPEQVRAEAPVGPLADSFALGSVLYECLTGQPPFMAKHFASSLARILMEEVPPVGKLVPTCPPELDLFVSRLLCKDTTLRPTADEAHKMLESLVVLRTDRGREPRPATVRGAAPATIGSDERRVRTLLLARGTSDGATEVETHERTISRLGARIERLVDGTRLGSVRGAGTPTDEAMRVARTALAMSRAMPDLAIAIATGHADAGLAVGELADRAAVVLERAAAGTVELDELTAVLLEPRFELARVGESVQLLRERIAEGQRTLLGRPTETVGRQRELSVLEATLDECVEEGVARAALVTAEAGIGKTRVAAELLARAAARSLDLLVLRAQGDTVTEGSPYGMLGSALRHAAGVGDPSSPDARGRMEALLGRTGLVDAGAIATLAAASGVDTGEAAIDPASVTQALGALAAASAAAGLPLVFVLDDLQWADAPSVEAVGALLAEHGELPIFALALARPEVRERFPQLFPGRGLTELRLEPLGARAATKLVRQVLPDVHTARIEALVARAEGNAFFLEELVRFAAEGGTAMPESVLGMVQARLQYLSPDSRRVLRAASVFGETFWAGGVGRLLESAQLTFGPEAWLEELLAKELVIPSPESRVAGERELRFRHSLVREACYAMLSDDERRHAHLAAGHWLEAAGYGESSVLARHARAGGDGARAMQLLLRAAKGRLGRKR